MVLQPPPGLLAQLPSGEATPPAPNGEAIPPSFLGFQPDTLGEATPPALPGIQPDDLNAASQSPSYMLPSQRPAHLLERWDV